MAKRAKLKKSEVKTSLILEHSRINREKSLLVLAKSTLLYFTFIFVGVVGFVGGFISSRLLNVMIVLSIGVLVMGISVYFRTMHKEEKRLNSLIKVEGRGGGK